MPAPFAGSPSKDTAEVRQVVSGDPASCVVGRSHFVAEKNLLANLVRNLHPLPVTFFGSYAIDMGLAHVGLSACPEQTLPTLPGRTFTARQGANPKRP
jgi:hypothetical protein